MWPEPGTSFRTAASPGPLAWIAWVADSTHGQAMTIEPSRSGPVPRISVQTALSIRGRTRRVQAPPMPHSRCLRRPSSCCGPALEAVGSRSYALAKRRSCLLTRRTGAPPEAISAHPHRTARDSYPSWPRWLVRSGISGTSCLSPIARNACRSHRRSVLCGKRSIRNTSERSWRRVLPQGADVLGRWIRKQGEDGCH